MTLFAFIALSGFVLIAFFLQFACCFRRNADQARAAEHYNALFAAALQSTRVGVLIRNAQTPEQPVLFINHAFTDITGYAEGDTVCRGSDFLFGWGTDKATITSFKKALQERQPATFDLLAYRKDGTPFWSEWHVSPVANKEGEVTHYVSLLTDISALRQTQEALLLAKEQAERASAVKTDFLAMMSHEIRTPASGVLGVLDLLADAPLDSEQRKLLDIAMASGRALHNIINDILDYAKIEAGKIVITGEPFSLRALLREVVDVTEPAAAGKNLLLLLDMPDDVPDGLVGDAGRIRQILLNLMTNAIKFTGCGQVALRVTNLLNQGDKDDPVALLRFEVIDTGIGIHAADQDKLFLEFSQIDPSFSRRFSGTGLGLAITRRLVKLLEGEIGVESKPGQGSKFWFVLPLRLCAVPLVAAPQKASHPLSLATAEEKTEARLLLVEDNDTNLLVASRYLLKAGHNADQARTGAEAVKMAQAQAYDLIFMDISMPDMDGLEATRRIRALGGWAAHVPIIALTAHVMSGDRERCLEAGMNDHLKKPLDYNEVVRTLTRWLIVRDKKTKKEFIESADESVASPPFMQKPVIDPGALQRLVEELGQGTALKIVQTFLGDFDRRIGCLQVNGTMPENATILAEAHTLKSASANCGLMRFSSLMAALESAAAAGDSGLTLSLLGQVTPAAIAAREVLIQARDVLRG